MNWVLSVVFPQKPNSSTASKGRKEIQINTVHFLRRNTRASRILFNFQRGINFAPLRYKTLWSNSSRIGDNRSEKSAFIIGREITSENGKFYSSIFVEKITSGLRTIEIAAFWFHWRRRRYVSAHKVQSRLKADSGTFRRTTSCEHSQLHREFENKINVIGSTGSGIFGSHGRREHAAFFHRIFWNKIGGNG